MVHRNCPYCGNEIEILAKFDNDLRVDITVDIEVRKVEPQPNNQKEIPKRDELPKP